MTLSNMAQSTYPKNKMIHPSLSGGTMLTVLAVSMTLVAAYGILRYKGLWGEQDTYGFTRAVRGMLNTGLLIPDSGHLVYPNGYAFQALATFLITTSDVSLAALQLYGSYLLAVWLVFPVWLLYRELTGTRGAAALAAVFLFIQPEFLFVILRGSHEKFTRGLMLLCLFLLLRSLRSRGKPMRFAGLILAFYAAAYALITFNNLLATSFIAAIALAIAFTWVLVRFHGQRIPSPSAQTLRRLGYATAISIVLAFLFTFYAYKPAQHDIEVMQSMVDRLVALFLNFETEASSPYTAVGSAWISVPVYWSVSIADWLLLLASMLIWSGQSVRWLRKRWQPVTEGELLLWSFYGAFAFMGAVSIAVDFSGAIASNLQHRVFPSFAMLAAPLVARWVVDWHPANESLRRVGQIGLAVAIGLLAVLSVFKATNEPVWSNKWIFYHPAEMIAIDWAGGALADRVLWSEHDERLVTAAGIRGEAVPSEVRLDIYTPKIGTRDFLISDVIRSRSLRLDQPLPVWADDLIPYDNGTAQIYHRRPLTQFQR